jgi:hypothetical protein
VHLFHYHLVTSKLRATEARYLGKLGFGLVGRYGRIGGEPQRFEAGTPWEELDRLGFQVRLAELQRGAVNVVIQPGHWELPRVDHLGFAADDDEFAGVLARAAALGLKVQEHGERRAFIATNVGFRLELHPPRGWIDDLLADEDELRIAELHLRCDEPARKSAALRGLLGVAVFGHEVHLDGSSIRFLPGGPQGRPELNAERFE